MRAASNTRVVGSAKLALGLTVPVASGAMTTSLAGILASGTYAAETPNWAGQAVGQDAVNLVIYPVMVILAWQASHGSLRAYLWWLGAAAYSTYSYLLYAGHVHFSGWFLVYVATFGASAFALTVGAAALDATGLRARFRPEVSLRAIGTVLAGLGALFALLWLSEVLPATFNGDVPQSVTDAGLATNPVWVLDLGLVLPAMIASGLLLRRRRVLGYLLTGPLLAFGVLMGVAIIGMLVTLGVRGEPVAAVPLVLMATTVVVEGAVMYRFLDALQADVSVPDVLRARVGGPEVTHPDRAPAREAIGVPHSPVTSRRMP